MSDPGAAASILAAKLHIASDGEYQTEREALLDWAHSRKDIRQCSCGKYGEDGYDGTATPNGWRCLDCMKTGTVQ